MSKAKTTTTTTTVTPGVDDNWGAKSYDKYQKLVGKVDYDHEAAEQLADALNEITELAQRGQQLQQMVNENKELHQFVWRSEDGVIALHDIGNDHLGNIMLHLLRSGRAIPRAIRGEAISRGIVIPAKVPLDWNDDTKLLHDGDKEDIV